MHLITNPQVRFPSKSWAHAYMMHILDEKRKVWVFICLMYSISNNCLWIMSFCLVVSGTGTRRHIIYLNELAENTNRGTLASIIRCSAGLRILFSYIMGPYTSVETFNATLLSFPWLLCTCLFFYTRKHLIITSWSTIKRELWRL